MHRKPEHRLGAARAARPSLPGLSARGWNIAPCVSTTPKPPMVVQGKATGVNRILFAVLSNSIPFERADVAATIDQAKGWPMYFQNYLNPLTLKEHHIVLQFLPAHRLVHPDRQRQHKRMVGGTGDDNKWRLWHEDGNNDEALAVGSFTDDFGRQHERVCDRR